MVCMMGVTGPASLPQDVASVHYRLEDVADIASFPEFYLR